MSRHADKVLPAITPIVGFDGVKLDVNYYLTAEYDDVGDASKELPAVIEWLNELRQAYVEDRDLAERAVKTAEATAYFDLRGTGDGGYAANYGGKPTEEAMKYAVALDPAVRAAHERLAVLAAMVGRLYGVVASFQAKVDLIRSSEATRRRVFEGDDRHS